MKLKLSTMGGQILVEINTGAQDYGQHRSFGPAGLAFAASAKLWTIAIVPPTAANIEFIGLNDAVELVLACQHEAYSMPNPPNCWLTPIASASRREERRYSLVGLQD
jgi:hypothetical protein